MRFWNLSQQDVNPLSEEVMQQLEPLAKKHKDIKMEEHRLNSVKEEQERAAQRIAEEKKEDVESRNRPTGSGEAAILHGKDGRGGEQGARTTPHHTVALDAGIARL